MKANSSNNVVTGTQRPPEAVSQHVHVKNIPGAEMG